MPKKEMKKSGGMCEGSCGACKCGYWLFPILILLITLVPRWYGTMWAKWVLVVIAILLLLKKFCPCRKK